MIGKNNKKNVRYVDSSGRRPPEAVAFEEAVLGALMLQKDAFEEVSDILKPECFYEKNNQYIFEAIQTLSLSQRPVDILTVQEQLKKDERLEEVGGAYYLSMLTGKVASTAHLVYHAKIVAQKYLSRELITFATQILGKAYDEVEDVDELMQYSEAKLFELSQNNVKNDVTQIDPVIKEALEVLEKASKQADGMSGLPSGFTDLDKYTAGWQKTDLIIIAARPAMGKTAFVLSMAKNMAVDMRRPVGVFSLEMSKVQLVNRLIVNVCEIEGEKIKSGRLASYEWVQLDKKIVDLQGAPLYIDDTANLSIFEFRTKARKLVREHHVEILIIDYLQLMNASGSRFNSREQEVSIISRSLKGLAKELNIPIIALSQLNRGVENRGNSGSDNMADAKRPQLADLRESGAIEQDADMVCFIHRPEYYKITEDKDGNDLHGIAELIIAKHRNGATGDVRLKFKNKFARFINLHDELGSGDIIESSYNSGESGISANDDDIASGYSSDIAPSLDEPVPF